MLLKWLLSAASGYLIGSFCMSVVISKYIFHDDVRDHGSGNAGATNMARTFGWGPGILTLVFDFLKCALAMWIGRKIGGSWGFSLAGAGALLGHCYPLYFGFRGGKAVTTGACVAFILDWRLGLIALGVFFVLVFLTKIVSISSVTAAVILIIAPVFLNFTLPEKLLCVFSGCLVIFMHRSNLKRFLRGEEPEFTPGHRDK